MVERFHVVVGVLQVSAEVQTESVVVWHTKVSSPLRPCGHLVTITDSIGEQTIDGIAAYCLASHRTHNTVRPSMAKHRADILRECCSCRIAVGLGGTPVQERFDAQITYAQHGEQFQTLEMAELVGSGDGGVAMQGLRERANEGVSPVKEILLQGVATIVLPLVHDTQAAFCLPVHVLLLHVVVQTAIEGGEDPRRLLLRTPITLLSRLASFIRVIDIGENFCL